MILGALFLASLLSSPSPTPSAVAREGQQATPATIDWAARGCTAEGGFGFRFGDRPSGPPYHLLGETRQPFPRVDLALTERSRRLFRVDTVGMFQAAPGSTQSDREAGRRLFEAVDARIQELGGWGRRDRVADEDGDIDITYSNPTDEPDGGVTLEVSLMLGGVWMSCLHPGLRQEHVREVQG